MLETSARLLRLLGLLQTPGDWTGAELAQCLQVDARTVRRDIQKLRDLGYPVHAIAGAAGYRLGAGTKLPPHHRLRFDYQRHDATTSVRDTEPHRLVHTGRRWYLIGWDTDR